MDKTNETRRIMIDPVTRIEGHARITLDLDEDGTVQDAIFHVNEFRGFEKFCEGRMYTEMPTITPRICGICPISHTLASVKACEMIQGIVPSPTGDLLRRLLQLGQHVSSHALSFFYLSVPDFLLGYDAEPATRNIIGVAGKFPDVARKGIRLRQFGQEISERITGKKIHSMGIAPGGTTFPLTEANRKALLDWIPEAKGTAMMGLDIIRRFMDAEPDMVRSFATTPTAYLGTVGPEGEHELYTGNLRFVDRMGRILQDQVAPSRYLEFIAERSVDWSYLTQPYYKPLGIDEGVYRVGPLARLNVATKMKTPLAQQELLDFRSAAGSAPVHGTFWFHWARLIETLAAVEEAEQLLNTEGITGTHTRHQGSWNYAEGVGSGEAPRGTLFHHYVTDPSGRLLKVNLLIATGQNNAAMNRSITDVARQYVKGVDVREEFLNRVESAIRCYDPCLSCSTHAMGQMPMEVVFLQHGEVVRTLNRGC